MSEQTAIEWADATWNPWEGCTKVSPGCANCYAEARNHRFGMDNWGKGKPRRRTSASNWKKALVWNRAPRLAPNDQAPRIFPSLCDWLDPEVPIEWLADFLKLVHDTPNLRWLLLTKRPELFDRRIQDVINRCDRMSVLEISLRYWAHEGQAPHGVWIGASVEDQQRADELIPELLKIPAAVRFLSVEPLLGPIEFGAVPGGLVSPIYQDRRNKIDWVIVGGESGAKARPCNIDWIRRVVQDCRGAGVPCFVKQLGSKPTQEEDRLLIKHPKGGDINEWPEDLRVREFPNV